MSPVGNNDTKELVNTLEPMIRRVVREELLRVLKMNTEFFHLKPEMPLYDDMLEISQRKALCQIEFLSHEEVWRE